ncbi:MAG: hypothetical protein ACRC6M_06675 [Microcystaceae cyanobacterium]
MVFPPPNSDQNSASNLDQDFSDIPPERQRIARQQANKWFFTLLISGLLIGCLAAFGVVQLIQHFGLANKPNHPLRIEPYQK